MSASAKKILALISVSLLLAACNPGTTGGGSASSSSSSSESPPLITHNVSYTGVIDKLEASIYQQGTHKLTMDDGQMVLLQSTDSGLNLDIYLGKRVEVRGSVETTVESGGMLMRVEEVTILETASSSSESSMMESSKSKMCGGIAGIQCENGQICVDDPSDSCNPNNGGADCSGMCVTPVMSSSSSSAVASSSSSKAAVSSSKAAVSSSEAMMSSAAAVSSSAPDMSGLESQIQLMAKQDYGTPSLWTQKYCTSHVGFCIPVHKNWYFKSFGATTSNLWHSEFAMQDITGLGQGPIVLNLVAGSSASMNATDGQVKVQGSDVIAYKDWNDGNHFELIADARLKAAVEYMISHMTNYTTAD